MRCLKVVLLALFTAVLIPGLVQAQTGSTGTVTGTGFDKSGAVVPNAKVELKDTSTNAVLATATNDVGQFVFTSVKPGTYQLKVTAPGFRQAVMNDLKVTVGKETLINVTLETGAVSEVVEVHATTGTELQTLNSSVGNELDRHTLENLPALNRDATSLLLLQPMATPGLTPLARRWQPAKATTLAVKWPVPAATKIPFSWTAVTPQTALRAAGSTAARILRPLRAR